LAEFQSAIKEFEAEEITVIAGSVDPIEKAKETAQKAKVTFPVGYGLDPERVSEITGAFYEKGRNILHAANFLIRPDKTIEVACYSSGPIGRFAAKDVLGLVKFYKSRK
jgi:peroxiredoxin